MANDSNDALERARRLLDKQTPGSAAATHPKKQNRFDETLQTAREFNENVSWLRKVSRRLQSFWMKVVGVAGVIWKHSGPIRMAIGPIARCIGRAYMRFWRWGAYRTDQKTEQRIFSKQRATVVLLFTAAMPFAIWFGAKPVAITAQQAFMAAFMEREAYMYFHGSETIEEGELYSVKTTSQVPATPESTLHMHVQSDLIYWIWYPEDLANAVPNEVAWGRVKYTGIRVKPLGWFPEVKDIEAIPLSELPDDHPAKSGHYYLSHEDLQQAKSDGVVLPGTNLSQALE